MREDFSTWSIKGHSIDTVAKLKYQLQKAIAIELATIPPYLCALYSIKDGTNRVATGIIRSVVMEEMLHLCMAANILNAIGGRPIIDQTTMLNYPDFLPESDNRFKVNLLKFSPEAISTFLLIEKPETNCPPPNGDKFHSIGQFYTAVLQSLEYLAKKQKIFTGDPQRQITADHYYGSGGKLIAVTSLGTANQSVAEIIGQGEGIDGTIEDGIKGDFGDQIELAHYFRFKEIAEGRRYKEGDSTQRPPSGEMIDIDWGAVYNMTPNPKLADYRNSPELFNKALEFNRTYANLLSAIQKACNGKPQLLGESIPLMYDLKYKAVELMKIPLGNGLSTAGPTFEPIDVSA